MQTKIDLIDQICNLHPSLGQDKGWSTYTGGMADTGHWFFRKMLDVPAQELQDFYDAELTKQKAIDGKPPLTEGEVRQSQNIKFSKSGYWISELEEKNIEKAAKRAIKSQAARLFGKR